MPDATFSAGPQPLVAVLAAGAGRRFGGASYGAKLDADLCGRPVGQWALDAAAAAGLPPGLIVVGPHAPRFAQDSDWPLLVNDNASDGIGTTIALAATAAIGRGQDLLVLLADMPLVTPAHIRALLAAGGAATLWPDGRAGVPALVGAGLLPQLAALDGDSGAGPLLSAQRDLARVPAPQAMLLDIDRPEDLAAVAERLSRPG